MYAADLARHECRLLLASLTRPAITTITLPKLGCFALKASEVSICQRIARAIGQKFELMFDCSRLIFPKTTGWRCGLWRYASGYAPCAVSI